MQTHTPGRWKAQSHLCRWARCVWGVWEGEACSMLLEKIGGLDGTRVAQLHIGSSSVPCSHFNTRVTMGDMDASTLSTPKEVESDQTSEGNCKSEDSGFCQLEEKNGGSLGRHQGSDGLYALHPESHPVWTLVLGTFVFSKASEDMSFDRKRAGGIQSDQPEGSCIYRQWEGSCRNGSLMDQWLQHHLQQFPNLESLVVQECFDTFAANILHEGRILVKKECLRGMSAGILIRKSGPPSHME